jgi:hypothetical protein
MVNWSRTRTDSNLQHDAIDDSLDVQMALQYCHWIGLLTAWSTALETKDWMILGSCEVGQSQSDERSLDKGQYHDIRYNERMGKSKDIVHIHHMFVKLRRLCYRW